MKFTNSLAIQKKFNQLTSGGSHIWHIDGNEFIEYGMGLRSVTPGHNFKPIVQAVYAQIGKANNSVKSPVIELECAEEF